jgi:predicted MFS family arabinose efflux permease
MSYRSASPPFENRSIGSVVAAFLIRRVVGFLTYVGAWLRTSFGLGLDKIGLLFMMSGLAAVVASPLSGWPIMPANET